MKHTLLALLALLGATTSHAVTIDGQFLDWTYADLKSVDEYRGMTLGPSPDFAACFPIPDTHTGTDQTYVVRDGQDDSRDIVAFYARLDANFIYFRVDFFDLKMGAETGQLDVYVMCDVKDNDGSEWLPDFTDCKTDTPWEVGLCVYDSENWVVRDKTFAEITTPLAGPRFDADQDAVEFALRRQVLIDQGWNGTRAINFQVFTTRDGTNEAAGELGGLGEGPNNSDLTDSIVDDDRGWGDGVLNGAISMNAPRTGRGKYILMMHGNQSFNRADEIITRIDHGRDPHFPVQGAGFFRSVDSAEKYGVPIELHLSGVLTHAIEWADPAFNARMADLRTKGLIDFIGGVYAEHIMPFYTSDVNAESTELGTRAIEDVYGVPRAEIPAFWVPERVARGDTLGHVLEANQRFGTNYKAVILDELTCHRDWFGYTKRFDNNEGNEEKVDLDNDELKIHDYNGMKIFFINRFAQKWKVETMGAKFYDCAYERSPMIGLRSMLLDLALDDDQEQVIVCMEDWEDWAGAPYRATPSRWNPDQTDTVIKYFGTHPWIEVTTTTKILLGQVDTDGDGEGNAWGSVTDTPLTNHLPTDYGLSMPPMWLNDTLPITSYTWVRDASEGNSGNDDPRPGFNIDEDPFNDDWDDGYHNWAWGSNYEEAYKDAVPLLRGSRYYDANVVWIPSGKKVGIMLDWANGEESPATTGITAEVWNAIKNSNGDADLLTLAKYVFMCMNYETAWHDEFTAKQVTGRDDRDDQKGILVSWLLPLMGKIRDTSRYVHAAEWAAGKPAATATAEAIDVDMDGENEYVLRNDKIYAIFENDGGRLTNVFVKDAQGHAVAVIGPGVGFADREGEEENTDEWTSGDPDGNVRRVTALRDEEYVNDLYGVTVSRNRLVLTSSDLKIKKFVTLQDGADKLEIRYDVDEELGAINVEIGTCPNLLDLIQNGRDHLSSIGCADCGFAGFENSQGGRVFATLGEADLVYHDDLARDTTLALTARLVLRGEGQFRFNLGFGGLPVTAGPEIPVGGFARNPLSPARGEALTLHLMVTHAEGPEAIQSVEVSYAGTRANPIFSPFSLGAANDSGTNGDPLAGDGIWTYQLPLPNDMPAGSYLFTAVATDVLGNRSAPWPVFQMMDAPLAAPSWQQRYQLASNPGLRFERGARLQALPDAIARTRPLMRSTASPIGPQVLLGGYVYDWSGATQQTAYLWNLLAGTPTAAKVEIGYAGSPLGLILKDDGTEGDWASGDSIFMYAISLPYGSSDWYPLETVATGPGGAESAPWPFLTVEP